MTATPDIIPSDFVLEIDESLTPEKFMLAAQAFFGCVKETGSSISLGGEELKWTVRVREGSYLLGVQPLPSVNPAVAQAVYKKVADGIDALISNGVDDCNLPETALKHLRVLSEISEGSRGKPIPLRLWINKQPKTVNPEIGAKIREDWRAEYSDYGTIEGRLESIGDKDGQIRLQIRDTMFKQTIRCYVPEDLLDEAFTCFRKRVEVSGDIHYRKNGIPISITASRIIKFPEDAELPSFDDVLGILSVPT